MTAERRYSARHPVDLKVEVLYGRRRFNGARARNLSNQGMLLSLPKVTLPPGTPGDPRAVLSRPRVADRRGGDPSRARRRGGHVPGASTGPLPGRDPGRASASRRRRARDPSAPPTRPPTAPAAAPLIPANREPRPVRAETIGHLPQARESGERRNHSPAGYGPRSEVTTSGIDRLGQPGRESRPDGERPENQKLDEDEGHHAPVDVDGAQPLGGHTTQIEEREPEGRRQEGGL